jgi:hypothetical protein
MNTKIEFVLNVLETKIPGRVEEFFKDFIHNSMPHVKTQTVEELAKDFILQLGNPDKAELLNNIEYFIGTEGGNGFLGNRSL